MAIVLAVIGIVFIAWAAPGVVYWIGIKQAGRHFRQRFRGSVQKYYAYVSACVVPMVIAPCFLFVPGTILGVISLIAVLLDIGVAIGGGVFALNMLTEMPNLRRMAFGQCLECGYLLRGNVSGVCPECGSPIDEEKWPTSRPARPCPLACLPG